MTAGHVLIQTLARNQPAWMLDANCADMHPGTFHPGDHHYDELAAKRACLRCPVKAQCLEYALNQPEHNNHGILAGLTVQERRPERQRRHRQQLDEHVNRRTRASA